MKGSPKQIKWAQDIIAKFTAEIGEVDNLPTNAEWWIDRRNSAYTDMRAPTNQNIADEIRDRNTIDLTGSPDAVEDCLLYTSPSPRDS